MTGDWGQAATAAFSFGAAVFGYLARRSGKQNGTKLDTVQRQTNGALEEKIKRAIQASVTPDDMRRAVAEEAIRDYLDGMLSAHLSDEDSPPSLLSRPPYSDGGGDPRTHSTERTTR